MLDIDKEREYDKNRKKDPEIMKKRSDDQTAYKRYYEKVGACAPSNPYAPESALPKSKRSKRQMLNDRVDDRDYWSSQIDQVRE